MWSMAPGASASAPACFELTAQVPETVAVPGPGGVLFKRVMRLSKVPYGSGCVQLPNHLLKGRKLHHLPMRSLHASGLLSTALSRSLTFCAQETLRCKLHLEPATMFAALAQCAAAA